MSTHIASASYEDQLALVKMGLESVEKEIEKVSNAGGDLTELSKRRLIFQEELSRLNKLLFESIHDAAISEDEYGDDY